MSSAMSMNHVYYFVSIIGPSIITIITLVLQLSADPFDSSFVHPNIGQYNSCQLGEPLPQFYYFHLIVIILLGFNFLLFFMMISVLIQGPWKLCRGPSRMPPSMSCLQIYRIFVELFFLMGVNWISESSWFFLSDGSFQVN